MLFRSGDEVLTSKGYRKVKNLFIQGTQPLIKINTYNGEFKCTANHKMMVYNENNNYEWKTAENLKIGEQLIITKMEVVNESLKKDSYTLSNGKWKITISDRNSWNGVNGTGNVSYKGCDPNGKCVSLTGGKIVCRHGICRTVWKDGNYTYILEQPITENGNADCNLTVRKDRTEILRVTGLKFISSNI